MTHLVPNPPPPSYDVPIVFSPHLSDDGGLEIYAWGVPPDGTDMTWAVDLATAHETAEGSVESEISAVPGAHLVKFTVRGLQGGQQIAVFRRPDGGEWAQVSAAIRIADPVGAEARWRKALADGTLPRYAGNDKISFYPYGCGQARPSTTVDGFLADLGATLDTIRANTLGKAILDLITFPVTIYPYTPHRRHNAGTSGQRTEFPRRDISLLHMFSSTIKPTGGQIFFSPQQWPRTPSAPGNARDEVLLHEFIHILDGSQVYDDALGFTFANDFAAVNITNVYSCMLGRGLRKDHVDFVKLPQNYFENPRRHRRDFKSNYGLLSARNRELFDVVASVKRVWNPFGYWLS